MDTTGSRQHIWGVGKALVLWARGLSLSQAPTVGMGIPRSNFLTLASPFCLVCQLMKKSLEIALSRALPLLLPAQGQRPLHSTSAPKAGT